MSKQALRISSASEKETIAWAETFARNLNPGDIVGLQGELGTGKTVISKGIALGLQFTGTVNSPSYTIVNEYPAEVKIYHIDLFRLDQNADWDEIGLDYYTGSRGICLIEWPERLDKNEVTFNYMIRLKSTGVNSREIKVQEL
jgi:tRNA threonylcarbamoyladenosine biosynthesis protein TsaE